MIKLKACISSQHKDITNKPTKGGNRIILKSVKREQRKEDKIENAALGNKCQNR